MNVTEEEKAFVVDACVPLLLYPSRIVVDARIVKVELVLVDEKKSAF